MLILVIKGEGCDVYINEMVVLFAMVTALDCIIV